MNDFWDAFGTVLGWGLAVSLVWMSAVPGDVRQAEWWMLASGPFKDYRPKTMRWQMVLFVCGVCAWCVWGATDMRNRERLERYENARGAGELVSAPVLESGFARAAASFLGLLLFGAVAIHKLDRPRADDEH